VSNKVVELFGMRPDGTKSAGEKLRVLVRNQTCPFRETKCIKTRKSDPALAIGTCVVEHAARQIVICPHRMLQRRQVVADCVHLLARHEPGNEFHLLPEVEVPGGMVDFVFASVRNKKIRDFVGIELQTLDTTGTIWPERQRLLDAHGIKVDKRDLASTSPFGMNWKMSAKTILVQLHHKVAVFDGWKSRLVLVVQDSFLEYIQREFTLAHVANPARSGDVMHLHGYSLEPDGRLRLAVRLSTDVDGVAAALGRPATATPSFQEICDRLERRLSPSTALPIT
jgi:hypothetical protein